MTTCPAPAGFFLARFKPVSARWPFGGSPPSGFRPDSRQAPSPPSVYFGVRPCFRFPGLRAWRPWKKTFHFAAINVFLPQQTRKNFPVGFAPMHHLFTEVRYRWLRAPATIISIVTGVQNSSANNAGCQPPQPSRPYRRFHWRRRFWFVG